MAQEKTLSSDEVAGRVLVLEALVVAALGLALRPKTSTSPEFAVEVLNAVKGIVRSRIANPDERLSANGEREAYRYLDQVLSDFSEQVIAKRRDQEPKKEPDKD